MHAVRSQHECRLDVVVHDERDAVTCTEAPGGAAALDDLDSRQVLETPLHDGRASVNCKPCGLQIVHKD